MADQKIQFSFASHLHYLDLVYRLMQETGGARGMDRKRILHLSMAVSEAVTNAVVHGNKEDPHKRVTVDIELKDNAITIKVSDQSDSPFTYDPEAHGKISELDQLEECGRGIYIMRMYADELAYQKTQDNGTCVLLTKYY